MNIEELKKEYETQDNRATAYPIYVMVQELICIGIMADDCSACCPYGDGKTKIEYKHDVIEGSFQNKENLIKEIKEYYDKSNVKGEIEVIETINVGYIWHPVEFFLTIKGAEEYMKANAHNHGKLRTYVSHFERRNFEMRRLLKEIGFKSE